MKGLIKIIPMFIALIVFSFLGTLFVLANGDKVTINLGTSQTPPVALGLVVLTSALVGMLISGVLCSIEVLALFMQNRALRKKLGAARRASAPPPKTEMKTEIRLQESPAPDPRAPAQDAEPARGRSNPL